MNQAVKALVLKSSRTQVIILACLILLTGPWAHSAELATGGSDPQTADAAMRFFENHVRPILIEHCFECHGPDDQSGDLRLDSRSAMLLGGESGAVVQPGNSDDSMLMSAVRYEGYEMPPSGPIADEKIEVLRQWIDAGGALARGDGRADRPPALRRTGVHRRGPAVVGDPAAGRSSRPAGTADDVRLARGRG